jgi:ParB family chromosome partitioning protein
MGHARALLGLGEPAQVLQLVGRIAREDLSVRDVERCVREMARSSAKGTSPVPTPTASWVRDLEERMRERLGTKVQIRNLPGYRGQIVLDYFHRADLDRLCALLAPRDSL